MIAQARADLAAAIKDATGLEVHPTLPERIHPPTVYLTEAEEFITPGETFASIEIGFTGGIIVAPTANEEMIAKADEYATSLIPLDRIYNLVIHGYRNELWNQQPYLVVPFIVTLAI